MSYVFDEEKKEAVKLFKESWDDVMSGRLTKQELAESYDSIADVYDKACNIESFYPILEAFMKLNLPKDIRIMDICCGTGRLGKLLYERGYTNIDGIDCSKKSIDKAIELGCYKNCYCDFFDSEETKMLEDGRYDVVFVFNAFQPNHLNSKFFDELCRIIKKGGYLAFKIRKVYTTINELKVFRDDIEKYTEEKKWTPAMDMFETEAMPGFRGPDGSSYIALHYVMKILI